MFGSRRNQLTAVVVLIVAAVAVVLTYRPPESLESMLDRLEARRLALPTEREPLYGEGTDGSAWSAYERAIALHTSDPERALVELHRGAHALGIERGTTFDRRTTRRTYEPKELVSTLGVGVAAFLDGVREGEEGAIDRLLDVQQFAGDLARSPWMVEELTGVSQLVPDDVLVLLGTDAVLDMSEVARARWLEGLDRLVATLPVTGRAFLTEVEVVAREWQRTDRVGRTFSNAGPGWRYAFSWAVAMADMVERCEAHEAEMARFASREPDVAIPVLASLDVRAKRDSNPLGRVVFWSGAHVAHRRYRALVRLELLRQVLAVQLGRDPAVGAGPLGPYVRTEGNRASARAWIAAPPGGPGTFEVRLGAPR